MVQSVANLVASAATVCVCVYSYGPATNGGVWQAGSPSLANMVQYSSVGGHLASRLDGSTIPLPVRAQKVAC